MNGILNILKPTGMTSHDVVNSVRRILNIKRVGHAGTLDPNVAGVLVICVGKGTKFSEVLINGDKKYICEVILGSSTDTQDSYGKILEEHVVPKLSEQQILDVLKAFVGEQIQVPPMFSAVKLNGRKLYEYARDNIKVEKQGKTINIKEIKLIKFEEKSILISVTCSKGTYMRTLCNDIGKYLCISAHMGVLVRVDAKGLNIHDSITLEQLKYYSDNNRLNECIIEVDKIVDFEKVYVDNKFYDKLIVGNQIPYNASKIVNKEFFIYCNELLIGIGKKANDNEIKINKLLI